MAGSIPNVELDRFALNDKFLDLEVDGGDGGGLFSEELSFSVPPEECSLTHVGVAYQDNFVSYF